MSDAGDQFPFTRPATSDVSMFIQWKGTIVCLDFHCPCGYGGHIDADFCYFVGCPACGQMYEMGTQVIARRADALPSDGTAHCWIDGITPDDYAAIHA